MHSRGSRRRLIILTVLGLGAAAVAFPTNLLPSGGHSVRDLPTLAEVDPDRPTASPSGLVRSPAGSRTPRAGNAEPPAQATRPTTRATAGARGKPRRGWLSGAWTGRGMSAERIEAFARWRGSPADTVTTYPAYATWAEMAASEWHVTTFDGFAGRLVYGLPLLPRTEPATLNGVAAGRHDAVFRAIARTLVRHGRGDSFVRIGLEANGTWFPWGATARTAGEYRAAYRRVAGVLRAEGPALRLVFDITCGAPLEGSDDRMAALTRLYPGDDVVDVVGCDHYDSFGTRIRTRSEWRLASAPRTGPGLIDVARFARRHGKGFAVPEWGLTSPGADGSGDNPYFIAAMHRFFAAHADVLVFENYFNEADDYLRSSIWQEVQNPRSAEMYRRLW